jgi:diacylglycerol kinase
MTSVWWGEEAAVREPIARRARRRWRDKFAEAWRGVKRGIRGHSSFFVHFFFAVLALVVATVLQCALWEWCIIIGCIGLVLTAELFNSAIETLFHGLDAASKARIEGCLDIAAGAVLVASMTAAIAGCLIFGHRLLAIWY